MNSNTSAEHDDDRDFNDEANRHGGKVKVAVTYANTDETERFEMPRDATLTQVFDKAYELLEEPRRPADKFFCKGGDSMADYLNLTLEQLHRKKICRKRHFEIVGETGGA